MKKMKFLIVFMGLITMFLGGCSNDIKSGEQSIDVQKRIGDDNNYEDFKLITDSEQVNKVKEILNDIEWWENTNVDMVRPADYRFSFPNPEAKEVVYEIWISPNKDKIEIVIDAQSKYIQLDKKVSAELFEILTGEKLSDFK